MSAFEGKFLAAGMSAAESANKSVLLEAVTNRLREMRGRALDDLCAFFVPGRVEVVGKHTDYAGGRSIVCAIERGICLVAAPRRDARVRILDSRYHAEAQLSFKAVSDSERRSAKGWENYPATVIQRIARDFPAAHTGADIVFASDLPAASGMSSSSALITAIFFALAQVNSLWQSHSYTRSIRTREELAAYLAAIENGQPFAAFSGGAGVGTLGGSEDHVAILCSRAGSLSQYSYCPIRLEREIPFPQNYAIVIGVSGVRADKTGRARDAYNRASLAARKLLDLWNRATERKDPSLGAAMSSAPSALALFEHILREQAGPTSAAQALLDRHSQFAEESNEIVPRVGDALRALDIERLGALVDRSEFLAETLLANQTPETRYLARSARELGAAAASAFGAGFGGSVWALVPSAHANEFSDSWANRYRVEHPLRADASEFLLTRPGPALLGF